MASTLKHIETQLIHAGEPRPRILGSIAMPIFQSAMAESAGGGDYQITIADGWFHSGRVSTLGPSRTMVMA